MSFVRAVLLLVLLAWGASAAAEQVEVRRLRPEVISVRPHDAEAFTQGLEFSGRNLYESTGRYGASTLRETNPATGTVLRMMRLPRQFFGEGITILDDTIYMLTWREGTLLVVDRGTLNVKETKRYEGEGWGLCHDGTRFIMSDGSERLYFRNTQTFDLESSVTVTLNNQPVRQLNELEFVNGRVWANVWQTNMLVEIDPRTGRVASVVDCGALVPRDLRNPDAVMNGIAWNPATETFFVTGKLWSMMYEVIFAPQ